jgi:hypothetical protein
MNIFVTNPCPIESAKFLDNKRVIKMILESAQMLSTAMHMLNIPNAPYKKTHYNHPASVWTRTTKTNYLWLLEHFRALSQEYTIRYGKVHKSFQYYGLFLEAVKQVPEGSLTAFVNCTDFKTETNVFNAYKLHLQAKWDKEKKGKNV